MRHIAAYLLLQIGGNASPTAKDVKKVLAAVGIEADDERLNTLISELKGKDINTLIAEGSAKLSSVPSGGGGGGAVSVAAGGGGGGGGEPEEKKEEKKEEEKEESDDDMGFGLFD
ncbi:60S acidic ribosomal protein P2 [Thelephora terrestris]|uniref:60S acidic ribosomal protein P2 n=1 Tax=Thelephora terrestris TaxID=56493 RepID=A0A9P6L779_9AGAM|nr:60S acidic ribosomal protein P2 [Thelephora terrestris]